MKVFKPPWVACKGKPIFSVDIHPDGNRFVTGGQGTDVGKVVIWNMGPLRSMKEEENPAIPRLLCQMDHHMACVNCVRWSNSGRFLASGADDKLVMIWRCTGGASKVLGSTEDNVETWRCMHTLRGHSGDVLDLAWSTQDTYLATCSVDTTVIVWNAQKFPEQVKVLRGHSGFVKGVSWDPVGKYLATQSDDKSIIIWQTRTWTQEKQVTRPFEECGGTTHALRLDWSPDGGYLVSAHAMNNSWPTSQLIVRGSWAADMDFVGHRRAVTCVRFSPKLFEGKTVKNGESVPYTCCAIGSRDTTFSIWRTCDKRPLVVMADMFESSVIDLAWSPSGRELLVCSSDGSIGYLQLTSNEIGTAMDHDETLNVLKRIYGKSVLMNGSAAPQIIESAEVLKYRGVQKEVTTPVKVPSLPALPTPSATPPVTPSKGTYPTKQIETRTPDGRRRITPIFLSPPPPDMSDTAMVTDPAFTQPIFASATSTEISKIVIEQKDSAENSTVHPGDHSLSVCPITPMSRMEATRRRKQDVVNTPEKRTQEFEPKTSQPLGKKRKDSETEGVNRIDIRRKGEPREKSKSARRRVEMPPPQSQEPVTAVTIAERSSHAIPAGLSSPRDRSHLVAPSLSKAISAKAVLPGGVRMSADVENRVTVGRGGGGSLRGRLRVHSVGETEETTSTWSQILPAEASLVACSGQIVAVALQSALLVYSNRGRLLLPNVALDSPVTHLKVSVHYVLVVTANERLFLWDMKKRQCVIEDKSISPVWACGGGGGGGTCTIKTLTLRDGVPLIILSNGAAFIFDRDMRSWLQLSSPEQILPPDLPKPSSSVGPLSTIQNATSGYTVGPSGVSTETQQAVAEGALQSRLASSAALKSAEEYKFWFLTYVRYLTQRAMESQLKELCEELLGSCYDSISSDSSNLAEVSLEGLNKRDLLKEIIPIIATNLKLQRLCTNFQTQLEETETDGQ